MFTTVPFQALPKSTCSKFQFGTPAQILVFGCSRVDLGGYLAGVRLVHFDNASETGVVARLREMNSFAGLLHQLAGDAQPAKRSVRVVPGGTDVATDLNR